MKSPRLLLVSCAIVAILAGCNRAPSLDASSAKTLKQSSEVIRASLTQEQRERYDRAVTMIIVSTLDPIQTIDLASAGTLPTQDGVIERLRPVVDGLTASDVLTLGDQSKAKVQSRLTAWQSEQTTLQRKYEAYTTSAQQAAQVKPIAANLRTVDSAVPLFGDNQVEVEVTLENTLATPITSVEFNLSLMPPGVAGAWVVQPFSKKFEQPVGQGKTATVKVGPILVNIPEVYKGPVQLEAQVDIKSVGLAGKPALKVAKWDQLDTMRLAKLESAVGEVTNVLKSVR